MKRNLTLKVCALSVASGFTTLALAEIALRVAGITYPAFYVPDAHRGWAHRPGFWGRFHSEGGSQVRFNRDGLRDRERAREKPPNVVRIAVLGDSYTQALQVPVERSFSARLEQRLMTCATLGGRAVEVINFGVASYGTAQEFLTLRHHVWQFSPDIVLLAVLTGNDIEENSRVLSRNPKRPYFALDAGALVLDTRFRHTRDYRVAQTRRSRVKRWIQDRVHLLQLASEARRLLARTRLSSGDTPPPEMIYREATDPDWQSAWSVTERLICEMRDDATRNDAQLVVTVLSNPIQVHPDPLVRQQARARIGVEDLFYPDRRLGRLCERENIPVLLLAEAFRSYAETNGVCLHGFDNCVPCGGHWNEVGHDLASRLLAEFLCETLMAPGAVSSTSLRQAG